MDGTDPSTDRLDVTAQTVAFAPMRAPSLAERASHSISLAVAVAAHAAALFALLPSSTDALGDDVTQLEAIAVSIVSSVPVSVGAQDATATPAANEAVEEKAESPPEPEKAEPPPPQVAALTLPPELEPPRPDALTLPVAQPEPPPPEPVKEKPPEEKVEEHKPDPQPAVTAALPTPPPQAAAPASVGVLREYAKRVATTLAKSKPKGAGLIGTVKLRFIVDETGRPTDVAVVVPSGTKSLDEVAIRTLARSEFPPPPVGLTVTQRTFEVPYQFR